MASIIEGAKMCQEQVKGKVCVTGASGFVASWLVKRLLLSGYHVTGTVRDPGNEKKVGHLWKLEGAKERLRLVKADLMQQGSFDEAIMGCQGVFHTASPVMGGASDPKAEIVEPAVKGTLNVLSSCKKNPSLRRVLVTSSITALPTDSNAPMDESCWASAQLLEEQQRWYSLSKLLAEKAAWEFCNENGIDLVTVIPSFVIGPYIGNDLPLTGPWVLGLLKGETETFRNFGRLDFVHNDDVALAHILLYETKDATGRYLCTSPVMDFNDLMSLLSKRDPTFPPQTSCEKPRSPYLDCNTEKLSGLGFKFKSVENMFDDLVESLKEQGRLVSPP